MLYDLITFDIVKSIKTLSKVIFYVFLAIALLALISGIFALIIFNENKILIISFFAVFIISGVTAIIDSILIYGFGEIIANLELLKHNTNLAASTEEVVVDKNSPTFDNFINNFRK